MKMNSMDDLLLHELQDLYSAETQIVAALPKMIKKVTNEELKEAFENHFEQTNNHVKRLKEIAELLDISLAGELCKGMEGLLKEGDKLLSEEPNEFLDQALIGAAQRVEHYEIAGYGCAITYAKRLENDKVVDLLVETLSEEEETDESLTEIAESAQEDLE